ncbi:MAG: hypothetical protein FJZ01_24620 [Candidatus Sericytochromatia bacterium]|nr:hypothetical protein [Candidatus Tanganyikabacteria bacterium]
MVTISGSVVVTPPTQGVPLVTGQHDVTAPPPDGGPAADTTMTSNGPNAPPAQDGDTTPTGTPAASVTNTITVDTPAQLQLETGTPQLSASQANYYTQLFQGYAQMFGGGSGPNVQVNG